MGRKKIQKVVDIEVTDDFVPDMQPVVIVKDDFVGTGLSSDELRKKILELFESTKENYLQLCECLYEVWLKSKFKSWNYGSFKEYAQKELGVKYGKAMALVNIFKHVGKNLELVEIIKPVGWDKMSVLCRVITEENAAEWIQKAQVLNCDDLKKEVRSFMKKKVPDSAKGMLDQEGDVRGTPIEDQLHSQTFQFRYDSKGAVMSAIEKVQAQTGTSASESLALICADYVGSAPDGDAMNAVLTMVKKYEKALGIRFVVIGSSGAEIIHGRDILTSLVKDAIGG